MIPLAVLCSHEFRLSDFGFRVSIFEFRFSNLEFQFSRLRYCGILPGFLSGRVGFVDHSTIAGNPDRSLPSGAGISNTRCWAIVGLLFVASLINYLDRATLSMALPLISTDFALGPATKGLLLSAFFWSYALMQVPIGWCADRYDLRWLYAGLFALWSFTCGLTGLAGSLAVLLTLRIVMGVGESIYLPGGTKIVSVLFAPQDRGFPSGFFDSGTRIGLALGAPLIAWLIAQYGWRKMFLVVGFSALLWLVPWLTVFPSRLRAPSAPAGAAPTAVAPGRLRAVRFNRNLLGICLGFFCWDYYWYLLVLWLPDYLIVVRHLPVLKAGVYAFLPYFVFAVSEPLGGWAADHLVRRGWDETRTRKGMVTIAFLTGLLLIPAARVASATAAIWLVAGASLVGLAVGNLFAIVQSCAPPEEVGLWTGWENFAGNIGGIIAPITTGLLISRTGSYFPGFALAALVLVAGLLAYWFIVGELKPPARPSS
jgi:ACS family D-galactonate transporter-like MFS transporter